MKARLKQIEDLGKAHKAAGEADPLNDDWTELQKAQQELEKAIRWRDPKGRGDNRTERKRTPLLTCTPFERYRLTHVVSPEADGGLQWMRSKQERRPLMSLACIQGTYFYAGLFCRRPGQKYVTRIRSSPDVAAARPGYTPLMSTSVVTPVRDERRLVDGGDTSASEHRRGENICHT